MDSRPTVINITGKVRDGLDMSLQSVRPLAPLKQSLSGYLTNSLKPLETIDIQSLQKVLSTKARDVEELSALDFEPNQRVGELIVLLSLVLTINQLSANRGSVETNFAPAWQKSGQGQAIKSLTEKESWDGFIYEPDRDGTTNPEAKVPIIPVEIKSLMINPSREKFKSLNELLKTRLPKFSEYFQSQGSIGAVLVLPYQTEGDGKLNFDIRDATFAMNDNVHENVASAMVFLDIKNEKGTIYISTKTYIVHKNPVIVDNGNMDQISLFELKFCKFKTTN